MLAVEGLIRDRLVGLPGVHGVHAVVTLEADGLQGRRLPALFVAHDGCAPAESAGQRAAVLVRLFFLVVVALSDVRVVPRAASAAVATGDLAEATIARLHGWQPAPGWSKLALVAGPAPVAAPGLLLYPLRFACERLVVGEASA